MKRYFRRTRSRLDGNQKEIVETLRQVPGVTVFPVSSLPFDIIVGWKDMNWLYEIKSGTKKKLKSSQEEFSKEWTGHWKRINNVSEILEDLGLDAYQEIMRVTSQSKAEPATLRSQP